MRELSVPSPLRCDVSVSSLNTYTTGADMPTRAPIYLFSPVLWWPFQWPSFPFSASLLCRCLHRVYLHCFLYFVVLPLSRRWSSYAQFADRALLFPCFGSSSLESLLCPFVPSKPACACFLSFSVSLPFLSPYFFFPAPLMHSHLLYFLRVLSAQPDEPSEPETELKKYVTVWRKNHACCNHH